MDAPVDLIGYGERAAAAAAGCGALTVEDVPPPPPLVDAREIELVGRPLGRRYSDGRAAYWCDVVDVFAGPAAYRALGLLTVACVLHRRRSIVRFPAAEVRAAIDPGDVRLQALVLDYEPDEDPAAGDLQAPVAFEHVPSPVTERHPLHGRSADDEEPTVLWDDGVMYGLGPGRTVANGFGPPRAAARLAALLLDMATPGTRRDTAISLEGHAGFRAVGLQSVELALHLGFARY